jgi:hypothetical protein
MSEPGPVLESTATRTGPDLTREASSLQAPRLRSVAFITAEEGDGAVEGDKQSNQHETSKNETMRDEMHHRPTPEPPTSGRIVRLDVARERVARGPKVQNQPDAYVSYFENARGEQMAFYRRRDEQHATLWHGEDAWQPVRIAADRTPPVTLDLDRDELAWLNACRRASGLLPSRSPRPSRLPIESLNGPIDQLILVAYEQQIRQGLAALFNTMPEEELIAMLGQMMNRLSRVVATRASASRRGGDGVPG